MVSILIIPTVTTKLMMMITLLDCVTLLFLCFRCRCPHAAATALEKKRKDYAFWRQFNEKPSIIPGCPGATALNLSYSTVRMIA